VGNHRSTDDVLSVRRSLQSPLPLFDLRSRRAALLIIDLQYGDAHRDYGLVRQMLERGRSGVDYYIDRVESTVIPNVARLLEAARAARIEVIHTRIQSLTSDGRDRSPNHRRAGVHWPPGSKEGQLLDEVRDVGDEIVISKTCGGAFNGTNLDYLLRNLEIRNLIVAGVVATGCVEIAVRDAADLGYEVALVEDATAAWTPEMHDMCMRNVGTYWARVCSTEQVIEALPHPVDDDTSRRGSSAAKADMVYEHHGF